MRVIASSRIEELVPALATSRDIEAAPADATAKHPA